MCGEKCTEEEAALEPRPNERHELQISTAKVIAPEVATWSSVKVKPGRTVGTDVRLRQATSRTRKANEWPS